VDLVDDMVTATAWHDQLTRLDACEEAVQFARGYATFAEAWQACTRGDWMLWWVAMTIAADLESPARRRLVWVLCQCVRLAVPYLVDQDGKSRMLDTFEAWARGDAGVTLKDVHDAADPNISPLVARIGFAAYAINAAYLADVIINSATNDVAYSAHAADQDVLGQCADLVRQEWPKPPQVL
jgi:hypothetical protein